jgi:hypothetical protein
VLETAARPHLGVDEFRDDDAGFHALEFPLEAGRASLRENFDRRVVGRQQPDLEHVGVGDKAFTVSATNGQINIAFTAGSANWPMVNAIEIVPGSASTPSAPSTSTSSLVRVNVGGAALTDASGAIWSADSGASGGYTWSTTANISGTSTPALYQSHRYGVFSYQYAVPSGSYTVNLKFAEPVMSGAGQRVFNVAINGSQVPSNFDIFAQAGGA